MGVGIKCYNKKCLWYNKKYSDRCGFYHTDTVKNCDKYEPELKTAIKKPCEKCADEYSRGLIEGRKEIASLLSEVIRNVRIILPRVDLG